MKKYMAGLSFGSVKNGRNNVLLFCIKPDGTFLRKVISTYLVSVNQIENGSYIVKSNQLDNIFLFDCSVDGNSIFFYTDEDKDFIYGTCIQVNSGRYQIFTNYKLKKELILYRSIGNCIIFKNAGCRIFMNMDVLRMNNGKKIKKNLLR